MSEAPLHFKTIVEAAGLLRSRQLSPVELTEKLLKRIEDLDGHLKGYGTLMADHAMGAARVAESEIALGEYRGLLHGVPVAVKDLCFTKGVRTMGGTKVLADHVPDFDATVVTRLEAAGAVLLGKLNMTEGAMAGYNPEFDIPLNPWNAGCWTGSSSSGSGVATAAGLCFGSLGSDTGGSIRFPSACNGIVGLKPTWGRVSRYGVLALAESLDHVGPMTRSVADAGVMLQAIAGFDSKDPTSLPDPVPDMLAEIHREITGIRIGFNERFATKEIDAELVESVDAATQVLVDLGAEFVEVELPDMDDYTAVWPILCTAEAVLAHQANYATRRGDYGPWFREWLDRGSRVTGAQYSEANNRRAECVGQLKRVLEQVDMLICPSMAGPPYPVTPEELYGPITKERPPKFQRFTAPFNFSGTPTLCLPCGFNDEGLPLSLQLAGKHLSEPLLCRVGHAFEAATNWHKSHPQI